MGSDIILSIDQGTTGTTVMAINQKLEIVAKSTRSFPQVYPKPGWVEHDLNQIWMSVIEAIQDVIKAPKVSTAKIASIGITNQRETVGAWSKLDGTPACNAIVWQCRRTTEQTEKLRAEGHSDKLNKKTGLVLDPYFSATKIQWLIQNVTQVQQWLQQDKLCVGTIDSYLLYKLTAGSSHLTDISNAARTLLVDIHRGDYDDELLSLFDVPKKILPRIEHNCHTFGMTKDVPGLPDNIPITGMAGDQQAALFGQACFDRGDIKCTYGTGAFIVMNTGSEVIHSKHGLLSTIAWQTTADAPMTYALEGSVFCAGSAVQWLRDGIQIIESAPQSEALALSVSSSADVVFIPALTGLGSPQWNPNARGLLYGISRDTTSAHITRATLEGIALQVNDVISGLQADIGEMGQIRVDGGAAANNLLMQLQADLAQKSIGRPTNIETTVFGAALLAGFGVGMFDSQESIKNAVTLERTYEPKEKPENLLHKWKLAHSAIRTLCQLD